MNFSMNIIVRTVSVFALSLSVVMSTVNPVYALSSQFEFSPLGELGSSFEGLTGDYQSGTSGTSESSQSSSYVHTSCKVTASEDEVYTGESVTLNWTTEGFTKVTINGEVAGNVNGSKTVLNLQETTTFKLVATNDNGDSCTAQVRVGCIEPPEEPTYCELKLTKAVDKTTAVVGDELTYTIDIKNTGTADCTGEGVLIRDWIPYNVEYVRHTVSPNLSAGHENYDVLTIRTLRFNGHDLTPGESGTITWTGKVVAPSQCGDFVIPNTAEATAKELDNFKTFVQSNEVRTKIDYDCPETPKECKMQIEKSVNKSEAKPGEQLTYTISVKNIGTADCTGSGVHIRDFISPKLQYVSHTVSNNLIAGYVEHPVYDNGTRLTHFNGDVLTPGESGTVTITATVATPAQCGDYVVSNKAEVTAEELNNFETWVHSNVVSTNIDNDCPNPDPAPVCDSFGASPAVIMKGDSTTLAWETTNATKVTINGGIGVVAVDGSLSVAPTQSVTYLLTAMSADGQQVTCTAPVAVKTKPTPKCDVANISASLIENADNYFTVKFTNDNDCEQEVGATSYTVPVDTDGKLCTWQNRKLDCQVRFDYKDIVLGANEMQTVTVPKPNKCYQIDWYYGISVKVLDYAQFGNPLLSYVISEDPYEDRLFGAIIDASLEDCTPEVPAPSCDSFTASPAAIMAGDSATLTWETTNATQAYLNNGIGSVDVDGSISVAPLSSITYTLTLIGSDNQRTYCSAPVTVTQKPVPSCDSFIANPSGIMVGGSSTLTWETTNATRVVLAGFGDVAVDGSQVVSPTVDTTYNLTVYGTDSQQTSCSVPVTVSEDPVPVCKVFTASPNNLPAGGGDVTLNWEVTDATSVSIAPTVGTVALTGTDVVSVTDDTTFVLTATDSNGDEVTCSAPVTVEDPEVPFSCENNVSFSASDTSIDRGDSTTLNWSTTDVDSVSISGIGATTLSGSETVSPSSDTTYTLTATRGDDSITCPVSIDVSTGGGGGGSATPRCELEISDKTIERGEEITLTWDSKNARELTLTDDRGKVLFTTDDYLSSDKEDYYEGEITLKPTRDTEYTLLVERGSRDKECSVKVKVEDDEIVVLETRDQQPLVAGISLSQVPYTGFEAGPFMTFMFYALLVAWSGYITYLIVIRKRSATETVVEMVVTQNQAAMQQAEMMRPDAFPALKASPTVAAATTMAPINLPTGTKEAEAALAVNPRQVDDVVVTELENRAHEQKALLSSDAVRHFIATTDGTVERGAALDKVIVEAKKQYPLEDGWIVLNEARMQNLCDVCKADQIASSQEPFIPATVPEGTGSLAEAIVTGNVVAAYQMIGNRPMFALADAAADLDAVFRNRKNDSVQISDLLKAETAKLSEDQLKEAIAALTGALDGTYTSEEEAVKMAIMKAVKAVA